MENPEEMLNNFIRDLEINLACEMEVNNMNFEAEDNLLYKEPIQLN